MGSGLRKGFLGLLPNRAPASEGVPAGHLQTSTLQSTCVTHVTLVMTLLVIKDKGLVLFYPFHREATLGLCLWPIF